MNTAVFSFVVISTLMAVESATIVPVTATLKAGCMYQGNWYPEGSFRPNPCSPCRCYQGRVACAVVDCFFTLCVDPVRDPDQCCPVCPNGPNCRAPDGTVIPGNQDVKINEHTTCRCDHGGFMSNGQAVCAIEAVAVTAKAVNVVN